MLVRQQAKLFTSAKEQERIPKSCPVHGDEVIKEQQFQKRFAKLYSGVSFKDEQRSNRSVEYDD